MAKATSIPYSSFEFEYWLNKAVEWGQATTTESQQDVCLHLPKLQEFLKHIYGTIQHMNTTAALKLFPMIGQLLGRLCWNPFVAAHDESQQNLLECLWCLYSADPENAVEQKANDWILSLQQNLISVDQEVRSFIQSLNYLEEDYHRELLKNLVSSLVKQLQNNQCDRSFLFLRLPTERWRIFSILCLPIITLPEVVPLVEALLTCCVGGLDEPLSPEFLDSVSNSLLQKKIFLSESAIMNLWLRYLPCLEQTILHLTESLVSNPCASLADVEAIITESLLPKVSAYHPSLFRVIDDLFRIILLKSDGHPKIITIIQAFSRCFVQALLQVQTQMPLKLYFPHNQQSLVVALLTNPSDVPSAAWCQHLIIIVQMLKRTVQDENVERTTNVFENWFLLVHFGDWLNIALQQLMTADDLSDLLLWLLMFYNNPLMAHQQEKQLLMDMKFMYNQLKDLGCRTNLNLEDVETSLAIKVSLKESHLKDLINQVLVSFLLFTEGGNRIAKEAIKLFALGGHRVDGVSELLICTAHRLKNTQCRGSDNSEMQTTIKFLRQLLRCNSTSNMYKECIFH
ncbi:Fanconi anemia group C protein [Narcine bancroftii]|uniref:Fanconi anemia group C protein n=1 Tax=Narcine bancroftii TaxID=1343680 RepID=UPI00383117E3